MRPAATTLLITGLALLYRTSACGSEARPAQDNNLRCVDLSDLTSSVPLTVSACTQILWRTENWEHNTFDPEDADSVGYPSVVKNDRGPNADNKYYLYYAHHDPCSGIGCAVSDAILGPYKKLASVEPSRRHSMVLVNPHYPVPNPPRSDPSHYSSPCVVWNPDEKLWFMYFHYYNHGHDAWEQSANAGHGHQMTGLATCPDLRSQEWSVLKDPSLGQASAWDIAPVLPTTKAQWMNSQSSYHSIQRLVDGRWLAFPRGTSADQDTALGFADSRDGRSWSYRQENPVIRADGRGPKLIYRPCFIAYLGPSSATGRYLVVWSESPQNSDVPKVVYGYTHDFLEIRRDPRGYADWPAVSDGPVSPWREGNRLYLFSGKHVQVMILPAAPAAPATGASN